MDWMGAWKLWWRWKLGCLELQRLKSQDYRNSGAGPRAKEVQSCSCTNAIALDRSNRLDLRELVFFVVIYLGGGVSISDARLAQSPRSSSSSSVCVYAWHHGCSQ